MKLIYVVGCEIVVRCEICGLNRAIPRIFVKKSYSMSLNEDGFVGSDYGADLEQ